MKEVIVKKNKLYKNYKNKIYKNKLPQMRMPIAMKNTKYQIKKLMNLKCRKTF